MMILKFLVAEKQTTATDRHWMERNIDKINQHRYLKNSLTLKQKSKTIFVQ